ncbi:MAG: adenosylhomocysteinase [Acidobacteriaceae bacterium]|nr:adenosylhomocysteinase [Acidobacteriaceae bacterium]
MSTNLSASGPCDIKDLGLAERGKRHIEWAFQSMCVLQAVRKQFIKTQPFARVRIGACLNVTAETANLMITLRDGGAKLALCAANPMSTQDDVAASLVKDYGISVFAVRSESAESLNAHVAAVVNQNPQITMDDGYSLIAALHSQHTEALNGVVGGTEETTTGALRVRQMANEGRLRYPVVSVNDAQTKQLFDNRYGTGQSTIDAIVRCTNVLIAGLNVVVVGYGICGRGVALRARGLGANVIVTEVDPIRALMASMDGYRVTSMADAATLGDVFVTVTGSKNVIGREHFERLKNGAILCNSGHSNLEIDLETLAQIASSRRQSRDMVEEFAMRDGRRIYVLAEGQVINIAAADGHPASVMDMSFGNSALCAEYLWKNHSSLEKRMYGVPTEIDRQVAKMKLESMGIKIDRLTMDQEQYLGDHT